ncbi:MAG: 16S rRNA (uracil(1498)-N(3))-methyltransferase [Clostridia bacterium]|nr:16S rRNA (uracil(1498)-N(3))-methyltransferase [Clostridia bacterium]
MPRFFVRSQQVLDGTVTVLGDDAHHISRSLRMAAGERIVVCDMQKNEYECELTEFLPDRVLARIVEKRKCDTEPPYRALVFQALPKGDKLDSVIQKAVECGAGEIITFESERCVVRAKGENEAKKVERRQRIALEAAKQSGRGIVPAVHPTVSFEKAISLAKEADLALFCYEGDGTEALPAVLKRERAVLMQKDEPTVSIVIGSEGGFSLTEAEQARQAGLIPVGLGKRILRTETAASFALACLVYELEMNQKS